MLTFLKRMIINNKNQKNNLQIDEIKIKNLVLTKIRISLRINLKNVENFKN